MFEMRAVVPADATEFLCVSEGSDLFQREELSAVQGMLSGHFAAGGGSEHSTPVYESGGVLRGVVCFTERPLADRVWDLQMIAVEGSERRRGVGSRMLRVVEDLVRQRCGRILWIETSDRGGFERTRQF